MCKWRSCSVIDLLRCWWWWWCRWWWWWMTEEDNEDDCEALLTAAWRILSLPSSHMIFLFSPQFSSSVLCLLLSVNFSLPSSPLCSSPSIRILVYFLIFSFHPVVCRLGPLVRWPEAGGRYSSQLLDVWTPLKDLIRPFRRCRPPQLSSPTPENSNHLHFISIFSSLLPPRPPRRSPPPNPHWLYLKLQNRCLSWPPDELFFIYFFFEPSELLLSLLDWQNIWNIIYNVHYAAEIS